MVLLRAVAVLFSLACAAYFSTPRAVALFVLAPLAWVLWARYLDKRPSTRVEFPLTAVFFLGLWFGPLVAWYVHLGIHASPEPWGVFNTALSPVGRSPCCSNVDSAQCAIPGTTLRAPYHPAGFFAYGRDAPKTNSSRNLLFCPVGRWADSTDAPPVGHNRLPGTSNAPGEPCVAGQPCDFLATTDPADYPDPGKGLRDGWSPGAVVAPTALCPGVARAPNAQGKVGRGQEICAQCAWPRPPHCADAADSQLFCFMCPGGYFGSEPRPQDHEGVRLTAELLFGQLLLLLIATCASVPRCGRSAYPKGYNPLF